MKVPSATIVLIIFIIFFIIIPLPGCGNNSNPAASNTTVTPDPNTIIISGFAFSPAVDTISLGTTITWKNNDAAPHTSTSDSGAWDTGSIPAGGSKTTFFSAAGAYPYHCAVHPSMRATIIVK